LSSYNKLTMHCKPDCAQEIVDCWNAGDICMALCPSYRARRTDIEVRLALLSDEAETERVLTRVRLENLRIDYTGQKDSWGRRPGEPVAQLDGDSLTVTFDSQEWPFYLRTMLKTAMDNDVLETFSLVTKDPVNRDLCVCEGYTTKNWRVVCNAEWIRQRIPEPVRVAHGIDDWAEEEVG
jgi:hypothetical protein